MTNSGKSEMFVFQKSTIERHIGLIAFCMSFFLSPWFYYPWRGLNSDGILYVRLAYIIDNFNLGTALSRYDWPFFSAMIATLHNFSQLSYVTAAYLLVALFMGFTALFFVEITKKLGGSSRIQWLAMLVFLSFETIINYRVTIFRDPGYWAFYLSAFYFFLEFAENLSIKNALLWFFSVITAICFRIEGMMLLGLTPLAVFFFNGISIRKKLVLYLTLYLPLIILLIMGIAFSLYEKFLFSTMWNVSRNVVTMHIGTLTFFVNFQTKVDVFKNGILPVTAKHGSAFIILFTGLTSYFVYKFFWSLGLLNTIMLFGAKGKKMIPFQQNQRLIFIWIFITSLVLPYNFIFQTEFINTRYLVSSTLTLLLLVPFVLEYCINHPNMSLRSFFSWCQKTPEVSAKKSIFTLKTLFIVYIIVSLGDFIFLLSEEYYKKTHSSNVQAQLWLSSHKQDFLPMQLCSTSSWAVFAVYGVSMSDKQIDHSSQDFLAPSSSCKYIVLVGRSFRSNQIEMFQQSPDWHLMRIFSGSKADRNVYLFERSPSIPPTPPLPPKKEHTQEPVFLK